MVTLSTSWKADEIASLLDPPPDSTSATVAVASGVRPADLPGHLARLVDEAPGADRSAQSYALIGAAVEWGLADSEVVGLAAAHAPTVEKYGNGRRFETEVGRMLGEHRASHQHVGQPCDKAGCADKPSWMTGDVADRSSGGATKAKARPKQVPTGAQEEVEREIPTDLFKLYSASDLLRMDRTFRWLVRGMFVRPTYGQIAGEMKTLKTYLGLFTYLALASGTRLFGRFEVDEAMPVVAYIGEGGRIPYTRRLERVAACMGVDLDGLPLHLSFDVAPIQSAIFRESLRRDLDALGPGLVGLDPYYAFHGVDVKSQDLHQEGTLLSSLSAPCVEAGASVLVTNHFNQTGVGAGLRRITQAGSGEWADSWLLTSHRRAPDVENGRFFLLVEIGSRQWGGATWDLDLEIGRFNIDTGEYDGAIGWELRRHVEEVDDGRNLDEKVLAFVAGKPGMYTKSEVVTDVGGNAKKVREAVERLLYDERIQPVQAFRIGADGRRNTVSVLAPSSSGGTVEDVGAP